MKVKEVYNKYKDYCIYVYGKPLENRKYMTPFSYLPMNTDLGKLEVKDMIIEDNEIEISSFNLKMQFKGKVKYKGIIYIYAN